MNEPKRKLTLKKVFYHSLSCEHQINMKRPYQALSGLMQEKVARLADLSGYEAPRQRDKGECFYKHLQHLALQKGWRAELKENGFASS